jgi:hypothetical protein
MLNQTRGLNSLSNNLLDKFFHLTLALIFPGTWWLLEGKGISCTSHPHSLRSLRAWNLIIWFHLFSLLEDYSCGVVVELIMLIAFIFIARVIILLLVCLIIIDLLYANASVMIEFIEEMLPNFLIFLVWWLFVVFSSIPGCLWITGCYTPSVKSGNIEANNMIELLQEMFQNTNSWPTPEQVRTYHL